MGEREMSGIRQIHCARTQPAESTGTLWKAPGMGYLGSKKVSAGTCLIRALVAVSPRSPFCPRGCSLSLLCSVTAEGRRKWEPLCLVPAGAHCFGSGMGGWYLACNYYAFGLAGLKV